MRHPRVLDQNHFLAAPLAKDPRIHYQATGVRAARDSAPTKPQAA